ncbi:hypothetical protein E0H26_11595 [Micromonospora zingiberis]|uniref:Uncharacterized protein n=1 Tax=Micromonospora zingiberis TaxID=2053011 RepID=A0A4V2LWR8_9ACTN|nr:hypothetical protein [Micromonospora zingiberis]TCB97555.1 hypothetical protein E0H26_11595 [Micromonospora zingiberis]
MITAKPGSRLDELLAAYAELKPAADEAAARLKTVTDAIKAELTEAAPGEQRIDVTHEALAQPLRLSYVESWRLNTKQLKAEAPEIYVRFAVKGGKWELRGIQP